MTERLQKRNDFDKRRRDFGLIDRALEHGASDFAAGIGLPARAKVLDLGCGTGIFSVAAARLGGDVTGVDPREPFLSRGRAWAKNAGLLIRFQNVTGARLPFSDNSFEVGASFLWLHAAPDPSAVIPELTRVVRDDGVIAVAFWSEQSPVAAMLRTAYRYCGDEGLYRALQWLEPDRVRSAAGAYGDRFELLERRLEAVFSLPAEAVAECLLMHHPLLGAAAENLPGDERRHLTSEIGEVLSEAGETSGDETRFPADYRVLVRR